MITSEVRLKTLVVIDNLHVGGVATSLLNYLKYTSDKQQCDLLVFNEESIDYKKLPANINVVKPQKILHILGKTQKEIRQESLILAFYRAVLFVISRKVNGVFSRKLIWPLVRTVKGYDLALAYAQDDSWKSLSKGCADFVIERTVAKKKAVVIHCDYKHFGGYHPRQEDRYQKFDFILNVSESCKKSFLECFPQLENKVLTCENFTDVQFVQKSSEPSVKYDPNRINFVTVCRLSEVKGLDRAIRAFGFLKGNIVADYSWVIVGDGPERAKLEDLTGKLNLSHQITFVGNKDNPYPYLKNASWFILPSRHEAAPMVFGECAALGLPIITTNTCSAMELVANKKLGYVVDNSEVGISEGIKNILTKKVISSKYSFNSLGVNDDAWKQFQELCALI